MKYILYVHVLLILVACQQRSKDTTNLQQKIDSLQTELANSYRPGFGEFMSSIQAHHIKLWFAGQQKNWELADFEVHEIRENLDDIRLYQADRKESKATQMLEPVLDSVIQSINRKDPVAFTRTYYQLTNTCNTCHRENDFGFNVVTIPTSQPFSNQDFSSH